MKKILSVALILGGISFSCNDGTTPPDTNDNSSRIPSITYSVASPWPHDTSYFTEGLEFYKDKLIESTGLNGKSRLIRYDIATGKIDNEIKLDDKFFGEGITVFRDTIYQLTYKEGIVHVYDAKSFQKNKRIEVFQRGGLGSYP